MGRGLARMEYTGFRQDMNEARDRFDEAAAMITKAIETGVIEGDGPYYPQPRVELRPKPSRSFKDRTYSVAMSPDSVDAAAELGVGMMTFLQVAMTDHLPAVERYRELFRAAHGTEPKPPDGSRSSCTATPTPTRPSPSPAATCRSTSCPW